MNTPKVSEPGARLVKTAVIRVSGESFSASETGVDFSLSRAVAARAILRG